MGFNGIIVGYIRKSYKWVLYSIFSNIYIEFDIVR